MTFWKSLERTGRLAVKADTCGLLFCGWGFGIAHRERAVVTRRTEQSAAPLPRGQWQKTTPI